MLLVKLGTMPIVSNISLAVNSVPTRTYRTSSLVNVFSFLFTLFDNRISFFIVIKVSNHLMGIEVVVFNAEDTWHFSSWVYISLIKHLLSVIVVDDVAIWINKISTLV